MRRSDAIVARARACVGAPFRPHGRDPRWGLDCVGVAAIAFEKIVPADYSLRGRDAEGIKGMIARAGLTAVPCRQADAGDLVLIEAGPAQLHLAILTERGFVHADARLRRVVETPGPIRPTPIGAWREEE
jgi:murein DD-endopeptidase / murein LD-carboxypeptidase